jgi:hypothetical protein
MPVSEKSEAASFHTSCERSSWKFIPHTERQTWVA